MTDTTQAETNQLTDERVSEIRELAENIGRNMFLIGDRINEWNLGDHDIRKLGEQVGLGFTTLKGYARVAREYSNGKQLELRGEYPYSILKALTSVEDPNARLEILAQKPPGEWIVEDIGPAIVKWNEDRGAERDKGKRKGKRRYRQTVGGCVVGDVEVRAELIGEKVSLQVTNVVPATAKLVPHDDGILIIFLDVAPVPDGEAE